MAAGIVRLRFRTAYTEGMKILVIGGSGFIGPHLVRRLVDAGHEVAVFHRGQSNIDLPVEHILGDRSSIPAVPCDIVVDLILSSGKQARSLMSTFRGVARRVVAASSCDVYRACGVLHGSEEGPLDPVPLTEDSPLRTKLQTYPPEQMKKVREFYPWADDEYDKIPVEHAILGDRELPGTICRLPMVYGPRDPGRRFFPVLRRVMDDRPAIFYEETWAQWKAPRGYVENVAEAIALAVLKDRAAGRIYNVADRPAFTELEWARKIADAASWRGELVVLPKDRMPKHLVHPGNAAQHWETDTSRIRRELGFREVVSTEEGIRRTMEWDRENLPREFFLYPLDYAGEDTLSVVRGRG
jgi:nucleoside-diphosphate-sugar epimerase